MKVPVLVLREFQQGPTHAVPKWSDLNTDKCFFQRMISTNSSGHSLWGILLFENLRTALREAVELGEALWLAKQCLVLWAISLSFSSFFFPPDGKERQVPLSVGISQQTLNPYCLSHVERLICSCCLASPKRPSRW